MPRTKTILVAEEHTYEPAFFQVAIEFAKTANIDPTKRSGARFYVSLAERDAEGTFINAREEDVERIDIKGELAYHLCGIVPYFIMPTRAQLTAFGVTEPEKLALADLIGGKLFAQINDSLVTAFETQEVTD